MMKRKSEYEQEEYEYDYDYEDVGGEEDNVFNWELKNFFYVNVLFMDMCEKVNLHILKFFFVIQSKKPCEI